MGQVNVTPGSSNYMKCTTCSKHKTLTTITTLVLPMEWCKLARKGAGVFSQFKKKNPQIQHFYPIELPT